MKPYKARGGHLSQEPPAERCLFPPIATATGLEQNTLGKAKKKKVCVFNPNLETGDSKEYLNREPAPLASELIKESWNKVIAA
jgi:hypothetical protein